MLLSVKDIIDSLSHIGKCTKVMEGLEKYKFFREALFSLGQGDF